MIVRIVKPALTVRRSLLLLGTVVLGLAFPAVSMAANVPVQIKTKAINKGSQGFKLTLSVHLAPHSYDDYPDWLVGTLFKHTPKGTENDSYGFVGAIGHPLKTAVKGLQSAKIKGTFANNGGSIDLTFHATGPAQHVSVPKGCTGHPGERRSGTLSGSFTLHADNLGTLTQKSFQATISTASINCVKRPHGYDLETSSATSAYVSVFKASSTGSVFETIDLGGIGDGWEVDHRYTVSGLPSSDFRVNRSKLNRGHVVGGGGISGNATYASTQSSTHHTTGTMNGSLAVTFASIRKVTAVLNGRGARASHL